MRLGGKVALNAAALGGARLGAAVLGLVGVGITTSYLGVKGYGALVVALAFVTVIGTLNDLGIGTIVAREIAKRPDETRRLVNAGFSLVLALSLVGAAAGVGLMFLVYPGGGRDLERQAIVLLLLLPLPLAAAGAASSTYFISQQRAYMGALASVAGSVLSLALLVGAVALDTGFTGVAVAYAAQAAGFGVVMVVAARRLKMRPGLDLRLSLQLLRWAVPLGAALLVASLYARIDLVLLSLLGSATDAGLYGLAYRFVDALLLLPTYVMITLLPEFSRLHARRERVGEIVQKAFDVMLVGIVPVVVVFVAFSTEIAELLGGGEFTDAGPVLAVLMLAVGLGFMAAVFLEPIIAVGHQKWVMWSSLGVLAVNVAANVALIPAYGAMGCAVAFLATEALTLLLLGSLYGRLAPLPRPRRGWRVLAAAVVMVAVAAVKWTALGDAMGQTGGLLVLAPLATVAYIGALYAVGGVPPSVQETLVRPLVGRLRRSSRDA